MAVDLEYYGVPPADYREQELRNRVTASAGQTTFSAPYSVGYVDVYFNGAKLDPFTEFTATDGANIVLTSAASAGDILEVISRAQVQLANVYTQQQVNALLVPYFGTATGTGNAQVLVTVPTFSSYVDGMDIKVRTAAQNTSTTPTIACNGLAAKTIVSNNAAAALYGSDWVAGSEITLRYNQALDKLVLIDGGTTAATPAAFNATNQLATTAFVRSMAGNRTSCIVLNTNSTLNTGQAGSMISSFGATANITYTVPAISSFPVSGVSYLFVNSSNYSVTLSSTSTFSAPLAVGTLTTFTILAGGSAEIISDGGSWIVINGSGNSSLTSPGFQRMPSGMIIQWGVCTLPASGVNSAAVNVTFPIAYKTSAFVVGSATSTANSSAGGQPSFGAQNITVTGFTANGDALNYTTFNKTCTCIWFSIGY